MSKLIIPSKYQIAIYDWVETCHERPGEVIVAEAVAGSGKTLTLVESIRRSRWVTMKSKFAMDHQVLALAYNVNIKEELEKRVNGLAEVRTMNSLGYRALITHLRDSKGAKVKFGKIAFKKYTDMVQERLVDMGIETEKLWDLTKGIAELISLVQANLSELDDDSLWNIVSHYGMEFKALNEEDVFDVVRWAIPLGIEQARKGIVNFDDQIYIPVVLNLPIEQYMLVLCDEAQDMSKAKIELVKRAIAPNGNGMFFGDKFQAIYSFAGADSKSIDNIIAATNAKSFPLSINYRCGRKIIEYIRNLVPEYNIEAAPDAIEGDVPTIPFKKLAETVKNGDLVICRLNAPLISACINLIRNRIAAKIKGKKIGETLGKFAKEVIGKRPWSEFDDALSVYRENELPVLMKKRNSAQALSLLDDKIECVRACNDEWRNDDGSRISSLSEFVSKINSLFDDTDTPKVVSLTTVHGAKGLEAENVFIIKPDMIPLKRKNQQEWEKEAEKNIMVVAFTRAKINQYIVTGDVSAKT